MVRLGLDNRGGESSCLSWSGGSGVRMTACPNTVRNVKFRGVSIPTRDTTRDTSVPGRNWFGVCYREVQIQLHQFVLFLFFWASPPRR